MQILIKFPDAETERHALGKLIPRFSGKSWQTGETAVPAPALGFLADQGIRFTVIGPNGTSSRSCFIRPRSGAIVGN